MLTPFEQLPTELILLILYFLKNPKYFGLLLRLNKMIGQKFAKNADKIDHFWSKLYLEHFTRPTEEPSEILIKHRKKYGIKENENNQTLYKYKLLRTIEKNKNLTKRQQLFYNWTCFGDLETLQKEDWKWEDISIAKGWYWDYSAGLYSIPSSYYNLGKQCPIYPASKTKRQDILTYFFLKIFDKDGGRVSNLFRAAACNIVSEVQEYLEEHPHSEWREDLLRIAVYFSHDVLVAILITAKVNVNEADFDNHSTPLFIAAKTGNREILRVLLEAGAMIDKANYKLETPLIAATSQGHKLIVQDLLKAGAKITQTIDGQTPLTIANKKQYSEIYIFLKLWKVKTETSHLPLLDRIICLLETNLETNTQNTITPEFLTKFAEKIPVITFFQNDSLNKLIIDLKKVTIKDEADEKRIIEMIKQQSSVVPNEKMKFLSQYIFQNSATQDNKEISLSIRR